MKETYKVAFTVTVDQRQLPPVIHLASEMEIVVRYMVHQEIDGLWGVSFDQFSVLVAKGDGDAYRIMFEVSVEDIEWPYAMEQEITRRVVNMVHRYLAHHMPAGAVTFDPASVTVTTAPEQNTAPADIKRPGMTPAPVTFSHETTPEPVAAAPAKRGWQRLFGRS